MTDLKYLEQLVQTPAESLSVEMKPWLDPTKPSDAAKIVKACLALWNNNGGCLLIGFSDDGLQAPKPTFNPIEAYHIDVVQALIAKYASYSFEIAVSFIARDDLKHPILCVNAGVRTPVAAKSDLKENGYFLIRDHAIYARSLNANNRASTSEAKRGDWGRLVDICVNNREADIAGFVRRHLSDVNLTKLKALFNDGTRPEVAKPTDVHQSALDLIAEEDSPFALQPLVGETGFEGMFQRSSKAFELLLRERNLLLKDYGVFEAVVWICGVQTKYSATESFLNLVMAANPQYTGWPFWVDTRYFADRASRPFVLDGSWETLIVRLAGDWQDKVDFWRIEPAGGMFYHRRALEDDLAASVQKHSMHSVLDWVLVLFRVAEVIGTGLAFAREMGSAAPLGSVGYSFRWTRLKGRELQSWSKPTRSLFSLGPAHDDTVRSKIVIPPDTAETAIFAYVHEATKPLFEAFGGKELSKEIVADVVAPLFTRKSAD